MIARITVEPRPQGSGFVATAVLFAAIVFQPSCITERNATPRTPTVRERVGPHADAPLTTRVDPGRSANSSAKVALQTLGFVPYDGLTLPIVAPDGRHVATQIGPLASQFNAGLAVRIVDLSNLPPTLIQPNSDKPIVLAYEADDEGFFVFRFGAAGERIHGKCLFDGTVVDAVHPLIDDRVAPRIADRGHDEARAFASIGGGAGGEVVWFDPDRSRMVAWMPGEDAPIGLAPRSIAACWLIESDGHGVLVTTNDGLYLQRLTRDGNSWIAEEPTRLLREPFVPRATNNPERPYILIGPGPKDRPEMLQIVAMRLLEE